jgi:chemotaxis protein MotB
LDNAPGSIEIQPIKLDQPPLPIDRQSNALGEEIAKERESLNEVSKQFQEVLSSFIDQKLVDVHKHDFWIELEMNSEMLFNSGESELSSKALPIIKKVAEVVQKLPNMVSVEGYTDNVPISTLKFPSNWDLSSARATSVVKAFAKENVDPTRLSAVGYGEFHPIADNLTEAGRFKNRRVVLLILSRVFSRYGSDDKERARLLNLETGSNVSPAIAAIKSEMIDNTAKLNSQRTKKLPGAISEQLPPEIVKTQ